MRGCAWGNSPGFFKRLQDRYQTGEPGESGEIELDDILKPAWHTLREARGVLRNLKKEGTATMSPELEDVFLCESWSISQAVLDDMSEDEIQLRKLVGTARNLNERYG